MRLLLGVMAVALAGCSTVGEIRQLPVNRSEEIAAPAERLSACVHDRLLVQSDAFAWGYLNSRDGDTFRLAANIAAGGRSNAFIQWEIAFVQERPAQTRVEVRTKKTIWGDPVHPKYVWPLIGACSR